MIDNTTYQNNHFYVLELDPKGNYLFMNKKFSSVYNLDIYKIGENALPSIIEADRPKFFNTIEECTKHPGETKYAFLRKKSDKGNILNQWEITAITDESGKVDRFRAVGFELEERHGILETQKKLVNQLTLERNTLNDLIFKIGHDLRSPVATLKGLLKVYHNQPEKLDVHILKTLIEKVDDRIKKMNSSLRSYASKPEFELIDLNSIIRDALKPYNGEILSNSYFISLNVRSKGVHLIYEYVQSIFDNLISNAMKYKSKDRKLDLEIEVADIDNDHVQITVWDNGLGLTEDQWKKHTKRPEKLYVENKLSNGVGLYLVKSQVEQMNGQISFTSEKGQHTEFVITFPKKPA